MTHFPLPPPHTHAHASSHLRPCTPPLPPTDSHRTPHTTPHTFTHMCPHMRHSAQIFAPAASGWLRLFPRGLCTQCQAHTSCAWRQCTCLMEPYHLPCTMADDCSRHKAHPRPPSPLPFRQGLQWVRDSEYALQKRPLLLLEHEHYDAAVLLLRELLGHQSERDDRQN